MKKTWYKKMSKSSAKNFCDDLWAELVKLRDENKCVMCGSTEMINAHHLISRRVFRYRWLVDNGITVCPGCHEFSLIRSCHTAPWAVEEWMKEHRPEQYAIWCKNRVDVSGDSGTDYEPIYLSLEEQYKKATGSYKRLERIASYMLFTKYEEIVNMRLSGACLGELTEKFNVGDKVMKEFLAKNKMN